MCILYTADATSFSFNFLGIVTMTHPNAAGLHVWTVSMLLVNMAWFVVLLVEMSILPVVIYYNNMISSAAVYYVVSIISLCRHCECDCHHHHGCHRFVHYLLHNLKL